MNRIFLNRTNTYTMQCAKSWIRFFFGLVSCMDHANDPTKSVPVLRRNARDKTQGDRGKETNSRGCWATTHAGKNSNLKPFNVPPGDGRRAVRAFDSLSPRRHARGPSNARSPSAGGGPNSSEPESSVGLRQRTCRGGRSLGRLESPESRMTVTNREDQLEPRPSRNFSV